MVKSVQNKDVGILGLAFKPNTNSVAGSSSLHLAKSLVAKGARVRAYDPVAIPEARLELNGTCTIAKPLTRPPKAWTRWSSAQAGPSSAAWISIASSTC